MLKITIMFLKQLIILRFTCKKKYNFMKGLYKCIFYQKKRTKKYNSDLEATEGIRKQKKKNETLSFTNALS